MKKLFDQSENLKKEYCCSIVQIGEITPIENSDFLAKTSVNGFPIVVRKDSIKEGDIMFYAPIETVLNDKFCKANNLYTDSELNRDTTKKGYFNKYGRVRILKLRGENSMGYLFSKEEMECYLGSKIDSMPVGEYFDLVNGELFVKAYVPTLNETKSQQGGKRLNKRNRRLANFNRMIPGEFSFHYETSMFESNVSLFKPEDLVSISVKLHGCSAIIGNIQVYEPKWIGGWYEKIFNYLPKCLQFTNKKYDYVYSSRSVIINEEINPDKSLGYANGAVQKNIQIYGELFKKYDVIPKGMTIYGEIVGYYEGTRTPIQKVGKDYDYGCNEGSNKLMIYRISQVLEDKSTFEWDVPDIREWTIKLRNDYPDLAPYLHPSDLLYFGKIGDIYPELDTTNHWHENLLEKMKNESKWFMEKNEPLCNNKVPREGIVIRKINDPIKEAFKLKTMKFRFKECENMDKGLADTEMAETYS